ncbi:MAG: FAD-dependent oxidoreductase [Myxococcota bacterium]
MRAPTAYTFNVLTSMPLSSESLLGLFRALYDAAGHPLPGPGVLSAVLASAPTDDLFDLCSVPGFSRKQVADLHAALAVPELPALLSSHLQAITQTPPLAVCTVSPEIPEIVLPELPPECDHPFGPDASFPPVVADALGRNDHVLYGEPRPFPGAPFSRRLVHFREAVRRPIPQTALVIGGGYIGIEMANHWASSGARVLLIERGDALLRTYYAHEVAAARAFIDSAGVRVRFGVTAQGIRETAERIYVAGHTPEGPWMMGFSLVLVAIGLIPPGNGAETSIDSVRSTHGLLKDR